MPQIDIQGLTADPNTVIAYDLSASASVTVLGGAGNTTYHLQNFLANVPLTLDPGGRTNTLDYSAVTGNVYVNLQTGVATDLAGFRNIQNVVGAAAAREFRGHHRSAGEFRGQSSGKTMLNSAREFRERDGADGVRPGF